MAFAGVSLVGGDGKLCASTVSPIDSGAASGYHLLVVEGFSRTRDILPAGEYIRCRTFLVGGHRWHLRYYRPNGYDSEYAGFVSLILVREEDDDEDENDDDWEANEDDVTDNDDEDEDDDCEDEDNDEAHDDDMAQDDDNEDEDHGDEHINNDDMAEDHDHDYHELLPSVKAQVSFCFIDQFQWLHPCKTVIEDFGLSIALGYRGFRKREILERSAHLKDDSFAIRCDIIVLDVKSNKGASTMAPPFIQVPPSDMPIHFKNLLLSEEGSDVTFVVGRETFAAHRCVLAARSTVFKSQLPGDNLGATTVKIDVIEAEVFEGVLTFIYTDTLPDWNKSRIVAPEEAEPDDYVSVHYVTSLLQLLEAAETYDLPRLKLICQEEFIKLSCGY